MGFSCITGFFRDGIILLNETLAPRDSCAMGIILRYGIILRLGIFAGWDYGATGLVLDGILLRHGLLAGRDFCCVAGLCATGNLVRDSYAYGILSFTMRFFCSEIMARRDSCATGFYFSTGILRHGTLAIRDYCAMGLLHDGILARERERAVSGFQYGRRDSCSSGFSCVTGLLRYGIKLAPRNSCAKWDWDSPASFFFFSSGTFLRRNCRTAGPLSRGIILHHGTFFLQRDYRVRQTRACLGRFLLRIVVVFVFIVVVFCCFAGIIAAGVLCRFFVRALVDFFVFLFCVLFCFIFFVCFCFVFIL